MHKFTRLYRIDGWLLIIIGALVFIGTIMVFSSSVIMAEIRWQAPYSFFIKQIMWVIIGSFALIFMSQYDYKNIQKFARILLILSIICLIAVLLIGSEKGGAKRWFRFGFMSFQPSELAKIAVIIALADYFDRKKSKINKISGILPVFPMIFLPVGLIFIEPDLGIPIIIVTVGFLLMYAAGAKFSHVFGSFIIFIPVVIFEVLRKPYRLERLKHFFSSWSGIESTTYQISQSIMALGSGGFWGKGLAASQMKLFHLPEPHTDFIFPIIGEELGFIGTSFLIFLFMVFAWRGYLISKNSQDFFGALLALGITWLIVFQAFFNIGVAVGILPAKGLPLPFVSFGGTSLLLNLACVGILLNISKQSNNINLIALKR
ncbi:MAG: putative lipid II flippase FtsW [Elusimicrobia bacterium]|nr:putative lipid II flippase FtsW [Elusimicrobiota bacterium]